MTDCPTCGHPLEWVTVYGGSAKPKGSIYTCERCYAEYSSHDLAQINRRDNGGERA